MSKGYQVDRYLTIPPSFVKNCLYFEKVDEIPVVIQDDCNKDWDMVMRFYKRSDAVLYKSMLAEGFKDFALYHELGTNAFLAFEMLAPPEPLNMSKEVQLVRS